MNSRKIFSIVLVLTLCLLLSVGTALAKPVTITFWHAMSGSRLGVVESIIESFNATHPDFEVKPLFTGSYAETLTKYVAAYPTKTGPNMVQVYEVGTQTMIDSDAITPVYQIRYGYTEEGFRQDIYLFPEVKYLSPHFFWLPGQQPDRLDPLR
ncbi:hypothetical protein ES708_15771 [subsurface metagenome]